MATKKISTLLPALCFGEFIFYSCSMALITFKLLLLCLAFGLGLMFIASVPVKASNILIFPLVGEGSHYNVMKTIAKNLLQRGHNVSMVIGDVFRDKLGKLDSEEQQIEFIFHQSTVTYEERMIFRSAMTNAGLHGRYTEWLMQFRKSDLYSKYAMECPTILGDVELITKLQNFDLSIGANRHKCPLLQYLRMKHGVKFVTVSTDQVMPAIDSIGKRIPFNPSYMPEMTSALDHHMTFIERLRNVAKFLTYILIFTVLKSGNSETRNEFGIADVSPYYEDAELFLINTNFALDFARPLVPSAIPVGGLSTKPAQSLSVVSVTYRPCN